MDQDLQYFSEENLNKGNLKKFVDSLPPHLKTFFNDSIGDLGFFDNNFTNVLQGYRGPNTDNSSGDSQDLTAINEIQEVKIRWGVSKHLLWIPIFGWTFFGVGRTLQITKWHSLYFDSKTGECIGSSIFEAAKKLNDKGNKLFNQGKYTEALNYFKNASKAYEADEFTRKSQIDIARTEVEICALQLNSEGDALFSQGKYDEAYNKYRLAFMKSKVEKECNKYQKNISKAQSEVEALQLSREGNDLVNKGRFSEALTNYKNAYNKSKIQKEMNRYNCSRIAAQVEVDAINLNSKGNGLYRQGKFSEALIEYRGAYSKSQNNTQMSKYKCKIDTTQTIVDKLKKIDELWNKVWVAENDTENDCSNEAEECLKVLLNEAKECVIQFSDVLKFKQHETLASLKIKGNELFNEGVELQNAGTDLLQEAQLHQPQKYKLANIKFKEAKTKFYNAQEKFLIGSKNDSQFLSCIQCVQDQLSEVSLSIEITEQHTQSQRLKINFRTDFTDGNVGNSDICEMTNNSFELIMSI